MSFRPRRSPLNWLRYQVYKRGYRPRWGAILYSPSLDLMYKANEGLQQAVEFLRNQERGK